MELIAGLPVIWRCRCDEPKDEVELLGLGPLIKQEGAILRQEIKGVEEEMQSEIKRLEERKARSVWQDLQEQLRKFS